MTGLHLWDVNKYKSEYESEEHWKLRKKFMETHMDKFPEDKLVCLARVFFNVEFLGCRYPEKTMGLIAELSKGVADEHREKQKGKLKRTFVQASDAASARIKGPGRQLGEPPKKTVKTKEGSYDYCSAHINFTKPLPQPSESGEFPGLIIFENCNANGQVETCPFNILNHSAHKCRQNITFSSSGRKCDVKINNKLLASEEAPTAKEAKLNAAISGLRKLRKSCYTIQVKRAFISNGPSISKDSKVNETDNRLPQDNIGSKMMQRMGWSGSGLGKSQQGIEDPVKAAPQIMNRAGLGCVNQKDLENKFTTVFKDYVRSDAENDLVFSPDFSAEERKILHRAAQKLNLKTRSYGKGNQRHLVVYKQLMLPELLQILVDCGGENEKYLLIPPTGEVDDGDSTGTTSAPNLSKQIKEEVCIEASVPMDLVEPEQNLFKGTGISSIKEENVEIVHEKPTKNLNENFDGSHLLNNMTHLHATDNEDITLVDEFLQAKDQNLQKFLERHNILLESYLVQTSGKKKKTMGRELLNINKKLQCYTGRHVNNVLNPVPANHFNTMVKHESRCMALGMALARNSPSIKELMCERIRIRTGGFAEKTNLYCKKNRKKVNKLIYDEIIRFGDELIKMLLDYHNQYKNINVSIPIYDSLVATNFISIKYNAIKNITALNIPPSEHSVTVPSNIISYFKTLRDLDLENNYVVPKNIVEKKTKHNKLVRENLKMKGKIVKRAQRNSLKNKIGDIKFVKENGLDSNNEESGIEYSDEERMMLDVDTGGTQQQESRDLSHLSPVYVKFVNSISRQVQPKPIHLNKRQNSLQTVENPMMDELQSESLNGTSKCGNIVDESQSLNAQKCNESHDNDEIGNFFSKISMIAKSLPPDLLTKLKYDIKLDVLKAIQAKELFENKSLNGK